MEGPELFLEIKTNVFVVQKEKFGEPKRLLFTLVNSLTSQSDLHGWAFYVVSSPLPAGTAQSRRRVNAAESAQTRV